MTAVVGILNKDAIAIAADSAVTITGPNGTKILNSANKLFRLSKYHPVGLMLYNSASFMGTPWETIIKIYRSQLGQDSFHTLQEYCDDFISFLRKQGYFTNKETSEYYYREELQNILEKLITREEQEAILDPALSEIKKAEVIASITASIHKHLAKLNGIAEAPDFASLDNTGYLKEFHSYGEELIKEVFINRGYVLSKEFTDLLHTLFLKSIKSTSLDGTYTGLIFCGFGQAELYPNLIPLNVSFATETRLHFYIDNRKRATITTTDRGVIRPFAQQDVMDTILTGVDPILERVFLKNTFKFISKYNEEILRLIGSSNDALKSSIEAIDIRSLMDNFVQSNRSVKQEFYIQPLINAIATLSKQDLAEMAESLIYLTYLKRRITFAEESVGGPVDVAVISKGDGFIWIKRKMYFDPKLNQHFFDNYYNL
ncbi:MAG: hypothetical protein RL007_1195 [Bacteroidota bacterium]|jgi:hypothetical protein